MKAQKAFRIARGISIGLLLLLFCASAQLALAQVPCSMTFRYIGSNGNVHEYEIQLANVPKNDSMSVSMTNMTGVTAAGVKAGSGWKVIAQSSHSILWTTLDARAVTARLTVTSADPVHPTRGQAFWVGGCASTGNITGQVRAPWGIPALTANDAKDVNALIQRGKWRAAISLLLARTGLDTYHMLNGAPLEDETVQGEGELNRVTREARVGVEAFLRDVKKNEPDANWLYSSIVHENVHAQQWAIWVKVGADWKRRGETMDRSLRELEAYLIELEFADRTGVNNAAARMQVLKKRLADWMNKAKNAGVLTDPLKQRAETFVEQDAAGKYVPKP